MRSSLPERLSARQAEIARLVARGNSTREIAATLFLSPRTVENHIAAIFNKLGVGSRLELASALLTSAAGIDQKSAGTTAPGPPTNLPLARTSLLARETEIADIVRIFEDSRLVTVIGAGGIGKTRSAIAVGEALLGGMPGGVWFVQLAALGKGAFVAGAIAQALDVRESLARPVLETLLAQLKPKRMLLILDNCEHVIADAAAIANALLAECPHLRILATSREPLRIAGEQTYRLPSLAVPTADESRELSAVRAAGYAALVLFAQSAKGSDRSFALSDDNAPIVADICRRLDGIPLAIELAAARVSILTVRALSTRLEDRFAVLTRGDRAALPRHQTMRALIDWSYDLLAPAEQRLFERLSVFAGGCDLAAATAVHADEADEIGVLALLSSLVDKSLVIADLTDREPRYRFLETTRQYAREKLAVGCEAMPAARRHALFYLELAERLEGTVVRIVDAERAWAHQELENWRAALDWSLEARGDVILGQRLAAATMDVWLDVSLTEGRRWLAAAVALTDERTPALVRARLDFAATGIAQSLGEWSVVIAESRGLIEIFRELGATLEVTRLEYWTGRSLLCLGRFAEGEQLLRGVLEKARSLQDRRLFGEALENIAYAQSSSGNLAEARAYIAEALDVWHSLGAERKASNAEVILAEAEFRAGYVERAIGLVTTALLRLRQIDHGRVMPAIINLAAYLIACDRWGEAQAVACEALGLAQETQRTVYRAWALQHVAAVAALSANAESDLAKLATSARLIGYVDARIAVLASPREYTEQQEYDRVRTVLRDALGSEEMERLMTAGAGMMEDQAVTLALSI